MGKFTKKPQQTKQNEQTAEDKLKAISRKINAAAANAGIGGTKAQKFVHGKGNLLTSAEQHDLIMALGGGAEYEHLKDNYRKLHL